jgi:hypothetical protein
VRPLTLLAMAVGAGVKPADAFTSLAFQTSALSLCHPTLKMAEEEGFEPPVALSRSRLDSKQVALPFAHSSVELSKNDGASARA